tara:strand:- start:2378 stop:2566 length:189 start_codon:yes stop_codon:yes gene_type:complete
MGTLELYAWSTITLVLAIALAVFIYNYFNQGEHDSDNPSNGFYALVIVCMIFLAWLFGFDFY